MHVSEYYNLGLSQPELDFVDVDIFGDARVFLDPRALRLLETDWGHDSVALIQNFFSTVLEQIRSGRNLSARRLLTVLREPNETHLGLSRGIARGRALGPESATDVWRALTESEAVQTGLLEDLEDTVLTIPGIRNDIVSDIATNVMRESLIAYTQVAANEYGIPLRSGIPSGPLWNPHIRDWTQSFVDLPFTDHGKLLLVPKVLVRRELDYNPDEYYRHFILPYLQDLELRANSELVQLLKNGTRRVTKRSLIEKYGKGKETIAALTLQHPEILDDYRRFKQLRPTPPLDHDDLAEATDSAPPDWDELLAQVMEVEVGRSGADQYHSAIESLLSAVLYPSLSSPVKERRIHEGRKRVDITYANSDDRGFFRWVGEHYGAPYVMVECKNYEGDPANPELDQLAGRFSPHRGRVGFLVCRQLANRDLFIRRCRDTASEQRGFILALDDRDLASIVEARKTSLRTVHEDLRRRFDELVM